MKGIRFYLGDNEVYAIETEPISKDKPDLLGFVSSKHGNIVWGALSKKYPRKNKLIRISQSAAKRLAPVLIDELNAQE